MTPIFWPADVLQQTRRTVFVTFNPLYHVIEVVRLPLTGRAPAFENYLAVLVITVIGWTITYVTFGRFRSRIAYWS